MPSLTARVRALWELYGAPGRFGEVAVVPDSAICPTGWVGVVSIDGERLAVAPTEAAARSLRPLVARLRSPSDIEGWISTEVLGPAALFYLDGPDLRPQPGAVEQQETPGDLLARVSAADAEECSLDGVDSPVFVVREEGRVIAAAGYHEWPCAVAHVSVLTAPDARGRGLAARVGGAAAAAALRSDLLPQWRARPAVSQRVAAKLGFRELGWQVSVRMDC